ncbi:MAG: SCO family protein [Hyphomicrobiaceae bacterium]
MTTRGRILAGLTLAAVGAVALALVAINEKARRDSLHKADAMPPSASEVGATAGGGTVAIGAPFVLTDQTGREVSDADFLGRPMIVLFGRVSDTESLRPAMQVVGDALQRLAPERRPAAVLVNLDAVEGPQSDAAFIDSLGYPWTSLTGPAERIDALARAYLVPGYVHTKPVRGLPPLPVPRLYLMNRDGRFQDQTLVPNDSAALSEWLAKKL